MTDKLVFGFAYLRLSREEAQSGESTSITNQRMILENYFKANNIVLAGVFSDDGYSGSNFNRPHFQEMLEKLGRNPNVTVVATKDLSRLGRDMRESSYYAEQYFPEHGIRYIAVNDNFDTNTETNMMAPFQFAMNEVYLRDCSRKIKDVIKVKRENGQYCTCAPYGYKKDPHNINHLVPDEMTSPIVQRIFRQAAGGDSARKIAMDLNEDGVIPPLKYRVLNNGEKFSAEGAARASDLWNHTTVKRILQNKVYLGNTYLGKTRKASLKSKKKLLIPEDEWYITENTHEPLINQFTFDMAEATMGRNTKSFREHPQIRQSIFSGVVKCAKCGYALCSGGTVYKGEKDKYWFLTCTHSKRGLKTYCEGVRIYYFDLLEVVRQDLNSLIAMTDDEIAEMTEQLLEARGFSATANDLKTRKDKITARQATIRKILLKLYTDNAEGRISDDDLHGMSQELENESKALSNDLAEIEKESSSKSEEEQAREKFQKFFQLIRNYTHIEVLDRETLLMFVDKIYIGERVYDETSERKGRNRPYTQDIRIVYKFIGEINNVKQ